MDGVVILGPQGQTNHVVEFISQYVFFSNKIHVSLFFIGLTFHSGMRIINVYNCKYVRLGLVYIFAASLWGFYLKCSMVFAL